MVWRVIIGTFSVVLTMVVFGFVAVTEQDRMASFERAYNSRTIEAGAALFQNNCVSCHGDQGQGGAGPALNAVDLFNGVRLKEIGWQGTLEAYLRGAINAGRPRASAAFQNDPQRMPAWGQANGGPLRSDQVESLVAYIMNWSEAFKDASGKIPTATATPNPNAVGSDINVELPAGDAANGQLLATAKGCTSCHVAAAPGASLVGPAWMADQSPDGKGVGTHATERPATAEYTGKAASPEQYLLESIIQPSAFIVPGGTTYGVNGQSTMPAVYPQQLEKQEVADIIAYLLTLH
ncbi:MAG: c-type cytochrome [Anaerolineales bacterium]|nr:c-type cytochrome [Anaerolineales bacterium]